MKKDLEQIDEVRVLLSGFAFDETIGAASDVCVVVDWFTKKLPSEDAGRAMLARTRVIIDGAARMLETMQDERPLLNPGRSKVL
jgi:hypothetical protein